MLTISTTSTQCSLVYMLETYVEFDEVLAAVQPWSRTLNGSRVLREFQVVDILWA